MAKSTVPQVLMAVVCVAALHCRPAAAIAVGSQAPAIQAAGWINGGPVAVGGKLCAVEFWATW